MQKSTMEAIVCYGPKDYRYETDVALPVAGPNEMVIKVTACGICASDCKCWQGAKMFWVTPGHEFFGEIVEMGEGSKGNFITNDDERLEIGDRIIAEQIIPCKICRYCRSGKYWMCEVHNIFGFQKGVSEGGMAEYMLIPSTAIVHKIPKSLSLEDSAIIEPLACAIHTVNRGDIQLDDIVVIAGAGPLGLMMTQVAHLKTPKKLVVLDMVDERLDLARQYGADVTVNIKKENVLQVVKELSRGYGCDVYIETSGYPGGVVQGLELIRKLGRFVEFSVFAGDTTVDWTIIGDRKELDIRGAHLAPYCYPVAIDLLVRGLCTSKGMVTHSYKLSEWDQAIAVANSLESIKVLMIPE
ncbi:alcohol dehydrogenase groES-like domain-containing protein [Ditylenchus destructor]|uniref:Alcohol dehydrogenase groES-like domain-containing protein n=1 Tax=Ditylenchus destructor TaxID=166010 RepID=A0AAD4MW79_9BILA|nr:alcohol dehydrogenase groES-like domain-containing protein [Ditylenchus destructor]